MDRNYKLLLGLILLAVFSCREEELAVHPIGPAYLTHTSTWFAYKITGKYELGIYKQGICWSEESMPTQNDFMSDGYYHNVGDTVYAAMTNLNSNTKYYVRAFANSISDTTYSDQMEIITDSCGILVDVRDNEKYNYVQIGKQFWMAENLRYDSPEGSWYFADSIEYSKTYGKFYDWETACKVCPDGWHLPSDEEWKELEAHLGIETSQLDLDFEWRGINQAFELMDITKTVWLNDDFERKNSTGFTAHGVGYLSYNYNGVFMNHIEFKLTAPFWTSNKSPDDYPIIRILKVNRGQIYRSPFGELQGLSVRCVKD